MSQRLYAFGTGVFFAVLQMCYFFTLQAFLSSVYTIYFLLVLAWLGGSIVGLNIKNEKINFLLITLCLLNLYIVYGLVSIFLFNDYLLPLYFLFIFLSGIYVGYFFNIQRKTFPRIKILFFWENMGFIIGLIFSLLMFIEFGNRFIVIAPILFFCLLGIFKKLTNKALYLQIL